MMFKKAQNISINVIIIAIVGLLVLVILLAIFGGKMGLWNTDVNDITKQTCSGNNGIVVGFNNDCPEEMVVSMAGYKDVKAGQKCCIPITNDY